MIFPFFHAIPIKNAHDLPIVNGIFTYFSGKIPQLYFLRLSAKTYPSLECQVMTPHIAPGAGNMLDIMGWFDTILQDGAPPVISGFVIPRNTIVIYSYIYHKP